MGDLQLSTGEQRVGRVALRYVHHQPPAAEEKTEGEAFEERRQARLERQLAVVVAHPADARHGGDPGAGERRDVHAVARVVLEVAQVHERGLGEVVVGELEVADLGRDHRLRARRQRRVANRQPLVVVEVAQLLLVGECIAAPVQREDEVRLLDHLLPVEVEVGEVKEQWVLLRPACARSPTPRAR